MTYVENPKTKGSKIICCVPQQGRCPVRCADCFYQPNEESGESRAYLGPHYEATPNIPSLETAKNKIVRVNDVNDSNNKRDLVMEATALFVDKFYNTSIPKNIEEFVHPVVLTVNPGSAKLTNTWFHQLHLISKNLMFVRARVNTWNLSFIDQIVAYYSKRRVPVVLTFMAYYETPIPETHKAFYSHRKRTLNSYWVINPKLWDFVVDRYKDNQYVRTCGSDANAFACTECRNCEKLYIKKIREMGLLTVVG